MCPEVLEKPKGAPKGVSLNIKLDVIKHIWHDFGRSFFGVWEISKLFPYKLMGIAVSLYAISAL